ncbi:MAG: alpha/beta hydrolase [Deltaproteobacteria bacterium]|jgi:pimeloyl-ACP methyl ester carboxylesterase|nr:alpha/beta hydrolase [Deltaproteobacteria bacterium]
MAETLYDYSKLDLPEVLQAIFHPRPEAESTVPPPDAVDNSIAVDEGVQLHARFHLAAKEDPNILFFHGNGEIVSDYDTIGPFYNKYGMNFLAADYRGYGRSTGTPTVTNMLLDSQFIFEAVKNWLAAAEHTGPLLIMGRSLGSAAALELAANHNAEIAGVIIESGFATTLPLLLNLGVDASRLGVTEEDGFRNVRKISSVDKPTLIIHGQYDEIIPVNSAAILQAQSSARIKELQIVPGASHNTVIANAGEIYFSVIKRFCDKISGIKAKRRRKYN